MQARAARSILPALVIGSCFVAVAPAPAWTPASSGGSTPASPASRWVRRYLQVAISPGGDYVASVEGDSPPGGNYPDLRELVIRRVSNGVETRVPLPCGHVPQCWPSSPAWNPDGKHLSFALRAPGGHAYSIYEVATGGVEPKRLFAFSGTLSDLKYGPDGSLAVLAIENARKEVGATEAGAPIAGDLDAAPAEQRIGTLVDGSLRWASPADLFVYQYDWRPDGGGFVGTASPGDGDNHWWTAKLYAFTPPGEARLLYSPTDPRQQLADPRVSPDGKSVAFIGGIMSDFGSTGGDVYTVALDQGAAIDAPGKALDVTPGVRASATSLAWSCQGTLRASMLAGDQQQIVDLGKGLSPATPRVLWSGTESMRGGVDAAPACPSDTLAAAFESFTQPPEIRVGQIGAWQELTQVNDGLTVPFDVRSLSWHSDGFDVQGWLLLPRHLSGKIPMVTVVHGGPAAASTPAFAGPGVRTAMILRGWAVFYPNPRGSFGQGERFTAANVRDFGYGDLRDILAGIDAAERVAPIDETRLGLMGGSYGGFMSMWAVTQTNRFKAAVATARTVSTRGCCLTSAPRCMTIRRSTHVPRRSISSRTCARRLSPTSASVTSRSLRPKRRSFGMP
jgi:dipeptidyl aminopeptidase/acylaminoacyl peptidase